jgi:hypothetical protein
MSRPRSQCQLDVFNQLLNASPGVAWRSRKDHYSPGLMPVNHVPVAPDKDKAVLPGDLIVFSGSGIQNGEGVPASQASTMVVTDRLYTSSVLQFVSVMVVIPARSKYDRESPLKS